MQVGIPVFKSGTAFFGWVILITQGVAGGLYVAVFFTMLLKNLTAELSAIGFSFAIFGNNLGVICFTFVTADVLGDKATPESIGECCWFLSILAVVGLLLALMLKYTDRLERNPLIKLDENNNLGPNNIESVSDSKGLEISSFKGKSENVYEKESDKEDCLRKPDNRKYS